jgi:PPM family protein phosphatase
MFYKGHIMTTAAETEKTIVESSGITDVGRKRKSNEDSYFIDEKMRLYVVADGMGGHNAGEVASKLVTDTIKKMMREYAGGAVPGNNSGSRNLSKEAAWLDSSITEANRLVYDLSTKVAEYKGMGSTLSAVFLTPDNIIAANVGDSPIYLFRKDEVTLLSVPHTAMAEYEAFAPAGSKPLSDKFRHMITRAMGSRDSVDPDFREIDSLDGDIIVICSDGLSDKLKPEEIAGVVKCNPPQEAGRILVDLANERGGDDNITIIIIKITGVRSSQQKTEDLNPDGAAGLEYLTPVVVEYDTDDFSGRALVNSITDNGLFIETGEIFSIGQNLYLTISDKKGGKSVMAEAKVTERKARGIVVKYINLNDEQKNEILLLAGKRR